MIRILIWLCLIPAAFGQSVSEIYRKALEAEQNNQVAEFLRLSERLAELRPQHPAVLALLAQAQLRNQNPDACVATLNRLVSFGLSLDTDSWAPFSQLEDQPSFQAVRKRSEANDQAQGSAEVAFQLKPLGLIPEGIAYDEKTKHFFLSSVRKHLVLTWQGTEPAQPLAGLNTEMGVFGLLVDTKARRLYMGAAAFAGTEGIKTPGASALLVYDLDEQKIVDEQRISAEDRQYILNDLCLTPEGKVYLTCNQTGSIYRYAGGPLEQVLAPGQLISPQGIVALGGNTFLIADYSRGLYRWQEGGNVEPVMGPDTFCQLGIDGLAKAGNTLFAIQNGVRPHRVLALDWDGHNVTAWRTLAANLPGFDEPTLGVVVGEQFYFIGNSQWGLLDDQWQLIPEKVQVGPKIYSVKF
ncbi:MAG: hypothetical protein KDC71_03930 [Acidobacteria bacterium]|nr:hypothetical protein [Acidobacteriota bacterium]